MGTSHFTNRTDPSDSGGGTYPFTHSQDRNGDAYSHRNANSGFPSEQCRCLPEVAEKEGADREGSDYDFRVRLRDARELSGWDHRN